MAGGLAEPEEHRMSPICAKDLVQNHFPILVGRATACRKRFVAFLVAERLHCFRQAVGDRARIGTPLLLAASSGTTSGSFTARGGG